MATKVNVLLLGGYHSDEHGIKAKESFIGQLIRRYARAGQAVSLTCHAPLTIREASRLLPRLRLSRYDLIIVQLGDHELQQPPAFGRLLSARPSARSTRPAVGPFLRRAGFSVPGRTGRVNGLKDAVKMGLLRSLAAFRALPRLQQVRQDMQELLALLNPYRYQTIIMTPFPHRDPISHWLRRQGRRWLLARSGPLHVFDTQGVVQCRDEFFLPNNSGHLNAVSHELLGSELYDYWRAESIILSSASVDRERR